MASLRNRTRRMLVMNLEHEVSCASGTCGCRPMRVVVTDQSPVTGVRAQRVIEKQVCASLTLLPREVRRGLTEAVLGCREVKAALRTGRIEVVAELPPAPVPAPIPAPKKEATP